MKTKCLTSLLLVATMASTGFQKRETGDRPGFTITVNGDRFHNQVFFIPPANASYANQYFDFKDDARAKRTVLLGYMADNSLQVHIDVPIHKIPGTYTFVGDSIPVYMGFEFTYEDKSGTFTYLPGRITVNITKYGKVGELIEGNFSGELSAHGMSFNDQRKIITAGTFKVKRIKDRM